jgi:hypothetical protein
VLIAAMTHFRRSVSTPCRIDSCYAERYRFGRRTVASIVKQRTHPFCVRTLHRNRVLRSTIMTRLLNHTYTPKNMAQKLQYKLENITNIQISHPTQTYSSISLISQIIWKRIRGLVQESVISHVFHAPVACQQSRVTKSETVGFEVFTTVVMKSITFWDVTPCSLLSCNRRSGGTYRLHLQGRRNNFS